MINIFFWLALLLLVGLARYHYRYALALAVAAIPLYLVRLSIGGIPTNAFELVVVAVTCGALLRRLWWRQAAAFKVLPRALLMLVLLWVVAAVVSTYISNEPRVSLGILKGWVLIPLLLGWLVYMAGPAAQQLVTRALIATGVISALFSLLQVDYRLLITDYSRISGFYDVPNSLALWLVSLIVLALWQFSRPGYLGALVMFVALALTQSVGGLLALLVTILIGAALYLRGKKRQQVIAGLLAGLVIAGGLLISSGRIEYLLLPWTQGQANSLSVRRQLWRVSGDLVAEHLLLGIGLGQFEPAYQTKLHERFQQFENCSAGWRMHIENCTRPLAEYVFRDPHNWILSMWLNTGLLGLISFVGIHGYIFYRLYRLHPLSQEAQATFLALLSLLIFGLVDTIYWKNDLATLQVLLIVTMTFATKKTQESGYQRPVP